MGLGSDGFSNGHGVIQIDKACEYIRQNWANRSPALNVDFQVCVCVCTVCVCVCTVCVCVYSVCVCTVCVCVFVCVCVQCVKLIEAVLK